ncbi:MAG: HD domain-containing protein [Candidatus Thorarchaeota archaeon]
MINIRQLGLKAYTGFPGAMHTRYVHCLGTMHLADCLRQKLFERESGSERSALRENLENNSGALKAAAFFHDVGHGPFSHVLDFVTQKELGKDHTELALDVIRSCDDVLERESIPVDQVCKIVSKKAADGRSDPYPFLGQIIDGPLDVDKMDYLLRDSFYVGLKYGFDLDHLMEQIRVLGGRDDLSTYQIGLADTPEAVVIAEHFLLIWRSMYTLVYFDKSTRIAEKMLEKAILVAIREDSKFALSVSNPERFLQLEETTMLGILRESEGYPSTTVNAILSREYYEINFSLLHLENDFSPDEPFMIAIKSDSSIVADKMSTMLNESEKEYNLICDIVSSRVPRNIRIDRKGVDEEPVPLVDVSLVVEAMSKLNTNLYVYVKPELLTVKKYDTRKIEQQVLMIIEEWEE